MPAGNPSSIGDEYHARLAARRASLATHERRHVALSRVRLAIVLAALVMALGWRFQAGWWYAVPGVAFAAAAVVHAIVLAARGRAERAVRFYERGLTRLAHTWMGAGDAGERYRRPEHPYAEDLDLFGRGSAFELMGTARTLAGQDTLASWLLEAAAPERVVNRQDAVRELSPRIDLRETLATQGETQGVGVDAARLRRWAAAPRLLRDALSRAALATLAIAVATLLATWGVRGTLTSGAWRTLFLLLLVEGLIAWRVRRRVLAVVHDVELAGFDLTVLAGVLQTIEREPVSADALVRIRQQLGGTTRPASSEIARLDRLVGVLQSRHNPIVAAVAATVACTTQVAFAIEAWRARVGPQVSGWLDAIGEFEALNAMAGHAAEHPDWTFPELTTGAPLLEAVGLAHPLLPARAVSNDVFLGAAAPHFLVVSGSNMSGKSTLLRAVGLNVVLAEAGAPVRAARFRVSPLAVGASIRIQDSLVDGRSRFLAEILRLKQIVDLARTRQGAVLFLLDEILGGTNSRDRRAGAETVLAGLTRLGAIGLITTHDLSLGRVAEHLAPLAANVHFADALDGGGLRFDYRMRPGVVQTSNALALMRSIGLDVPLEN